MRVLQVIAGLGARSGGPSYCLAALCRELARAGADVRLHALRMPDTLAVPGLQVTEHPGWLPLGQIGFSGAMKRALCREATAAHVVHNNSIWMMPNLYAARAARAAGRPLVTTPHGTLAPAALRRSRGRKAVMRWLGYWRPLSQAALLHATSEQERRDIRAQGLRTPVAVIPNIVELPPPAPAVERPVRRILFLGRLHPIKGLDMLLAAWSALEREAPAWELILCGPDIDDYAATLRRQADSAGLARATIRGPVAGAEKDTLFAGADLFVLPSRTENFGMSAAEALAAGVPVIATHGTPWAGLVSRGCGWHVEGTPAALAAALREAVRLDAGALRAMGLRGRAWIGEDFSAPRVGAMMLSAYHWILGTAARPPWVFED